MSSEIWPQWIKCDAITDYYMDYQVDVYLKISTTFKNLILASRKPSNDGLSHYTPEIWFVFRIVMSHTWVELLQQHRWSFHGKPPSLTTWCVTRLIQTNLQPHKAKLKYLNCSFSMTSKTLLISFPGSLLLYTLRQTNKKSRKKYWNLFWMSHQKAKVYTVLYKIHKTSRFMLKKFILKIVFSRKSYYLQYHG